MAIINAIAIGKAKGSLGNMTLRYVKGATVGSQKVLKKGKGGTFKQVRIRAKWGNLVNLFQAFSGTLKLAFEGKNPRVSDFNAFIARNVNRSTVYLTSGEVLQGGAVVFGAQITEGSLPAISHMMGTGDVLVSDLSVGSMSITASTSLKAFSNAIVSNNQGWAYGDQLSVYMVAQSVNSETNVPYVTVTAVEVTLSDTDEETVLRDIAGADAISVVDGHIGMGATINGAACYVHSRETANGLQVSTQSLVPSNSILPSYQSASQMMKAIESYHGDAVAAFLTPNIPDTPVAPMP